MNANEKGDVRLDGDVHNEKELSEATMIEYAVAAGDEETKLGLRGIIKHYYPAAMWSMLLRQVKTLFSGPAADHQSRACHGGHGRRNGERFRSRGHVIGVLTS